MSLDNSSFFVLGDGFAFGMWVLFWAAKSMSKAEGAEDVVLVVASLTGSWHLRSKYLKSNADMTHPAWAPRGSIAEVERISDDMTVHLSPLSCLPAAVKNSHWHLLTSLMISANVLLFNRIICGGVSWQGHSTETVHMSMIRRVVMFVFFGVAGGCRGDAILKTADVRRNKT